jgi:hypothetical protein
MNMRFALSSENWRSPLRLIDSLLPPAHEPRKRHPGPTQQWMRRFSQAGWLGTTSNPTNDTPVHTPPKATGAHAQIHRTFPMSREHPHGLRLSGRVNDVCAELERLDRQEMAL